MPRLPMKPKAQGQPSGRLGDPAHDGAKITVAKYWAELKIAAAVARSTRNQAATVRLLLEGRRLGEAHGEAQREQHGDGGGTGEEADEALEDGDERPDEDRQRIDDAGAETIEQPAARQLTEDGPTEGGEDGPSGGIDAEFFDNTGPVDGENGTVGIVDRRDDEQHHDDPPTEIGS